MVAPLALPAPPTNAQPIAIVPAQAPRPYAPALPYRPYTPYPPPVLPPQPRIVPVNQVVAEEEPEEEYNPPEGDEDYEIYPEYYVNDPERPKPVYQVTALGRGQSMNNVGRRPPLQCYGCGGPHKYSECPDRKPLQCFNCGEPHKVADCPYKPSTSANPVPNLHLPKATCSDCGITHLIPQCPHKPPEAPVITPLNMMSRIILSEKPKPNPTLNALTRLQAKADPILAAKNENDAKSTTSNKRQNRKKKANKSKKKIVGTTSDPVTIQNASDDSDNSSKSNHDRSGDNQARQPKKARPNKPGVYPAPEQEIQKLHEAIELVQETQAALEPNPKPLPDAWKLPTTINKPIQTGKPLQVPSVISKKSEEEHEAQFERWYQDMLKHPNPEEHESHPRFGETESQLGPLDTTYPPLDSISHSDHDKQEPWNMPFPPQTPSEGRSVVGAQLNAQKLINFLGMPTTTTMLVRLKGDPELAETLRSFLNDELAVNLETLQEAPLEHIPP